MPLDTSPREQENMRLICPNCDAQYEVDDAAIPPEGRDVQCSSCGHAWFEMPKHAGRAAEADFPARGDLAGPGLSAPQGVDPDGNTRNRIAETDAEALTGEGPPHVPLPKQEPEVPRRRHLDDSVLAVLREEAAREAAARSAESPPPGEVQDELGLAPPASPVPPPLPFPVPAGQARFADPSVRSEEPAEEDNLAARPAAQRGLLPDIEEINSTLRAINEPREEDEYPETGPEDDVERRGFRTGLVLIVFIAVLMWSAYVSAPGIVSALPASESVVQAYVEAVDQARLGVNTMLQSANRALRDLIGLDGQGG